MSKYDEIINLPHHVSLNHKQMNLYNRAAQFAPFAALKGYNEAIKETSRETYKKIEISEEEKELIDMKLNYLKTTNSKEEIFVIYYFKDLKKAGGIYKTYLGIIHSIDEINKIIIFEDNTKIKIDDIKNITSKTLDYIFNQYNI